MLLLDCILYAISGAFTGLLAGILGIGGGIIVVPSLLYIFEHQALFQEAQIMHVAVASSLAIMVLTSQSAVRAHLRLSDLSFDIFHMLWPGLALGSVMGVLLAGLLPTDLLRVIFAFFLLCSATHILTKKSAYHHAAFPSKAVNMGVMSLIGLNSGLLGVGGGTLIIPYLLYCGVQSHLIPALTGMCTLLVALLATLVFMFLSGTVHDMPAYSTGYIYWPAVLAMAIPSMLFAPIGARLMYQLPRQKLQYLFVSLLFVIAIHLLVKSIF